MQQTTALRCPRAVEAAALISKACLPIALAPSARIRDMKSSAAVVVGLAALVVQAQAQTTPPANQGREAVVIRGVVTPERMTETLENQAKRRQEAGGAPF